MIHAFAIVPRIGCSYGLVHTRDLAVFGFGSAGSSICIILDTNRKYFILLGYTGDRYNNLQRDDDDGDLDIGYGIKVSPP